MVLFSMQKKFFHQPVEYRGSVYPAEQELKSKLAYQKEGDIKDQRRFIY
jgi:hypothetical protein